MTMQPTEYPDNLEKPTVSSPTCTALLCCPFCGEDAVVQIEKPDFQVVGCSVLSMLCPNPSMTVYKVDGEFDYTYWNRRAT